MKYLIYLITLLFSTAVAQNPTILQGNYVSNVFGQANFVLNPNAQTSTTNVTLSNATATRSTTTPLVATTEFNVTVTSANGTVVWNLRPFDEGMKNQNCEARFTYRGFQATSKVQITRSGAPVGELVLTPSATDPRIASINFPCGDLSVATKFLVTDTATLSGTNEIGGIYVGLATNQANVAQAESVLNAIQGVAQTISSNVLTDIIYDTVNSDRYGSYNSSTGVYTVRKSGTYLINAEAATVAGTITVGNYIELKAFINTTQACRSYQTAPYTGTYAMQRKIGCQIEANAGDTIKIAIQFQFSTRNTIAQQGYTDLQIARLPSSSELVVTPETQNVWGGVEYRVGQNLYSGTSEPTGYNPFSNAVFNVPSALVGKASVTTTNSGNDLGFSIQNLPVGSYKLSVSGEITSNPGAAAGNITLCTFRIRETTTSTTVAEQVHQGQRSTINTVNANMAFQGVFNNTSTSVRNFRLEGSKTFDNSSGNTGTCNARGTAEGVNTATKLSFTIEPLDNASNSALYVQGPVKGSGTGAAIPAGYLGSSEFGGGWGNTVSVNSAGVTLQTISNVTPGVYMVKIYGAAQRYTPTYATFAHWSCTLTSSSGLTVNWYDALNNPQTYIGSGGSSVGASADIVQHSANNIFVNVASSTTFYVRCGTASNNNGFRLFAGAEFIRLN